MGRNARDSPRVNLRRGQIYVRLIILVLAFTGGRGRSTATVPGGSDNRPAVLLISMDAFRWDYIERHPQETPHLRQMIATGGTGELIPVFPSNTFPNHYAMATGLYPSHHGIINNEFFDPDTGEFFHYNQTAIVRASHWWRGEPVWVTAVRQGRPSAASFWPGSDVEIGGYRPTYWKTYDAKLPYMERVEELFSWLHLPPEKRPAVITLYLEETNSAGHKFGPDSPELAAAVKLMDDRVGGILQRASAEQIPLNIVLVSDHGMTKISTERVVLLDDYIAPGTTQIDFDGAVAGLRPIDGDVTGLLRRLEPLQHAKAYSREDLPARLHITGDPRNPPVWVLAEDGWEIYFRSKFALYQMKFNAGDHGYDPAIRAMHGILITHGPAFRSHVNVGAVDNINVYNLVCAAAGLQPAPNDGDDRLVRAMLVAPKSGRD